ncbi:MAG: peptide deformylase [Xenococcaceae cyanobacterium MO_188.B19]|nr:peptide deformylase [Xenococcaceae cyanobacterium MO_188.B19]MDJ0681352.1 peptide deformylase [Xenococcaceae cyanobacterium MO_167.B52]
MEKSTLDIVKLGNPILRTPAQSVSDITDPQISQLIDSLIATAEANNGVGIAAPQVSESFRLFIVASRPSIRYPHAPKMQPTPMINPKIVSYSKETVKDWEGCLSVPGLRGLITRYQAIEVEYCNREGLVERRVLTDFIARIFQHELDHLNGMVFLDRLESQKDLYSEEEYQKLIWD